MTTREYIEARLKDNDLAQPFLDCYDSGAKLRSTLDEVRSLFHRWGRSEIEDNAFAALMSGLLAAPRKQESGGPYNDDGIMG